MERVWGVFTDNDYDEKGNLTHSRIQPALKYGAIMMKMEMRFILRPLVGMKNGMIMTMKVI